MEQNQQIKIIDKVSLTKDGLFVKGTKQEIHLQQGSLDGACAVYSMMMCLIINKIIKRKEITDLDFCHDGRKSKGRLVRLFLEHKGFIRKGYYFKDLQSDLNKAFRSKINSICYYENERTSLVDDIIEVLQNNLPAEIGFTRKGSKDGHAVVAIGYQESNNSVSFFCLDPGFDLPKGQFWNNILQVDTDSTAKYNCLNHQEKSVVTIDQLLLIEPK